MASVDLGLQLVDGEHNVLDNNNVNLDSLSLILVPRRHLEDLLGEGHGPDGGRGGQLHEGGLGRQHPAQQQQEQRVVTEGDHGLQHPEDRLMLMIIMQCHHNVVLP